MALVVRVALHALQGDLLAHSNDVPDGLARGPTRDLSLMQLHSTVPVRVQQVHDLLLLSRFLPQYCQHTGYLHECVQGRYFLLLEASEGQQKILRVQRYYLIQLQHR